MSNRSTAKQKPTSASENSTAGAKSSRVLSAPQPDTSPAVTLTALASMANAMQTRYIADANKAKALSTLHRLYTLAKAIVEAFTAIRDAARDRALVVWQDGGKQPFRAGKRLLTFTEVTRGGTLSETLLQDFLHEHPTLTPEQARDCWKVVPDKDYLDSLVSEDIISQDDLNALIVGGTTSWRIQAKG